MLDFDLCSIWFFYMLKEYKILIEDLPKEERKDFGLSNEGFNYRVSPSFVLKTWIKIVW